jgi:hypothetical protein
MKNPNRVPVPAASHPAPGVQHQPPAGYLAHDLENGVEVNQASEFPPTRFCSTRAALANQFPGLKRPLTTRKESSDAKKE